MLVLFLGGSGSAGNGLWFRLAMPITGLFFIGGNAVMRFCVGVMRRCCPRWSTMQMVVVVVKVSI